MPIGIIGAMDQEIEAFIGGLQDVQEERKAGITYYKGKFNNQDVVICKSGVGKVNASVCTQILIDQFNVSNVLFTGVAGALDPELNIGDIVISSDSMHHDMDATALGFKLGEIPYSERYIFEADTKLIEIALHVSKSVIGDQKTIKGRILSGDQFIASRDKVEMLYKELNGSCTEMEGSAVAQVCDMNAIPFVIIRSMSDKADGSADVNFMEFVKIASDHSYQIIDGMLKEWK